MPTTTPLSERLASALVALEDAASCYDGAKAADLRASARAWARIADEADGVAPSSITEAERATMRAALNATASDRDEWKDRAQDAASGVRLLRATLREIGECAEQLPDEPVIDAVRRLKARAEAAEHRAGLTEIEARDLRVRLTAADGAIEAAERRLAEATKPGPATDGVFPVIWRRALGVPSDAGHFGPRDIKAAREIYNLGLAHGRAEQAARVAELEAETRVSDQRLADLVDKHKAVIAAWQAATGAATPGGVCRREPDWDEMRAALGDKDETFALGGTIRRCRGVDEFGLSTVVCNRPVYGGPTRCWRCCGIYEERERLTAPGPVVLPGATPSARPAVEAFDLPAINWTERKARYRTDTDGFHAECWWQDEQVGDGAAWTATLVGKADTLDDARATVERARRLLTGTATARPAQTSDGGAHAPAPVAPGDDEVACDACPATDNRATATDSGWALSDEYDAALCPKCHEPASAHVAQPAPVEPAKGARFVVADRESANRAARLTKVRVCHFLGLTSATNHARDCNADPSMFAPDDSCAGIPAYTHAVVDTVPPVATPAPSDVERLAAAIRAYALDKFGPVHVASKPVVYAAEDAAGILRHLAGPLPGADRAEELAIAYWKEAGVSVPMGGPADGFVDCLRRALLAVAQEPARVTVGEILAAVRARNLTEPLLVLPGVLSAHIGKVVAP